MKCFLTKWIRPKNSEKYFEVPCGKCAVCLSNKRNDWSFRLQQEWKHSKGGAFITLTYSEKFVPKFGVSKDHMQKFMKRLRKRSQERIRYYLVGEYGPETGRPHYHLLIFNYEGDERFLHTVWPFGIVDIRPITTARIHYVTKYIIQKFDHKDSTKRKPFALMSRGFGIGLWYLTDSMLLWHRDGDRNYSMVSGEKIRLSRYYAGKIWPEVKRREALGFCKKQVRDGISKKAQREALQAHEKNVALLRKRGYKDPEGLILEMRNAVISRIKQKVSFTQKL